MQGKALTRIEVWDALECDDGSPLAVLGDWENAVETWRLDGREELTVQMSRQDPAFEHVQEERTLRLVYDQGGVAEFDIRKVGDEKNEDGALTATLTCQSVRYRLGHNADLMEQVEANGLVQQVFTLQNLTPAEHVAASLPFAPDYFSAATVDPTDRVTLTYELDTPQEALQRLAEEADAELDVIRDGATGYLVQLLTERGVGEDEPYFRADRNVTRLRHETDSRKMANRITPRGAGATMAEHAFEVASVSGTDVVLASDDGRDVVGFDDQLNDLYLEKPDGTLTQVTDTVESSQTVVVVDASGLSAGDLVTFRRNASGTQLTYLDHPVSVATYGPKSDRLDRQDLPPVNNLVRNPDLSSWTSGSPDGWQAIGSPTIAEENSGEFARSGGASAHVTLAEGEGIETEALTVRPTEARPNVSGRVEIYLVSGQVRFELVDVTNGDTYPSGSTIFTSKTGQWIGELGIDPAKVNFHDRGTSQMRLRIVAEEASEMYLDMGQMVNRAGLSEPLFAGRASNELWHAANRELERRALPAHSYDLRAADLHRLDPDTYPHDEIILGADVRLYDDDLGLDLTTRIVQITREHRTETATRVRLSSAPADLEGQLGARGKKRAPTPPEPPVSDDPPSVDVDYDETEDQATLHLTVFDPQNGELVVEFQARSGVSSSWSSTDERTGVANGSTESKAVTLVEGHRSSIRYRVTGSNGVSTRWKSVDFDHGTVAQVEELTAWVKDDGSAGADVAVDTDTETIYLAVTTDGTEPTLDSAADADETVDVSTAGRSTEVSFGGADTVGKGSTLRVKARGENSAGDLGPVVASRATRPGAQTSANVEPQGVLEFGGADPNIQNYVLTAFAGPDSQSPSLEYKWRAQSSPTPSEQVFDHDGDTTDDWFPIGNGGQDTFSVDRPEKPSPALTEVIIRDTSIGSPGNHPRGRAILEAAPKNSQGSGDGTAIITTTSDPGEGASSEPDGTLIAVYQT